MIIIPIGVDCGTANFLKRNGLRYHSFPFDWCVTYNGISLILKNNFKDFIPIYSNFMNEKYGVKFIHSEVTADMYNRRVERFLKICNDNDTILFLRKGHAMHNHDESHIKCEKKEAYDLDEILQEYFPKLNYKILYVLLCKKCKEEFPKFSDRVDIIDKSEIDGNIDNIFEETILLKLKSSFNNFK